MRMRRGLQGFVEVRDFHYVICRLGFVGYCRDRLAGWVCMFIVLGFLRVWVDLVRLVVAFGVYAGKDFRMFGGFSKHGWNLVEGSLDLETCSVSWYVGLHARLRVNLGAFTGAF